MKSPPSLAGLALALLALATATQGATELLLNSSLDEGIDTPTHWTAGLAGGTFQWTADQGRQGSRSARLGSDGGGYALLHQSVGASAGVAYTFKGWTRHAAGEGHGELKLEFKDSQGRRLAEHVRSLHAASDWSRFFIVGKAPAGTVTATAVVVGLDSGALHFDDLTLSARQAGDPLVFDLGDTRQTFQGFGTQVWAYPSTADYPNLELIRAQALEDYSIRYVRVELLYESTDWDDLRALRAVTDDLDIEWISMVWAAPGALQTPNGLLANVGGFARWWARHVASAYANGIPVEYIELMNEPDSGGQWSTGISYGQYAALVVQTRRMLDRIGLGPVGIVGPGTSSTSWSAPDRYLGALSAAGVDAMAAWSTHSWADDYAGAYPEGPVATAGQWPTFAAHGHGRDPTKPRFVTEYATKLTEFGELTYRPADASPWDDDLVFPYHNVTNGQPYAAHVFANTLALLNAENGAEALLLWQLIDEPTEVLGKAKGWGMIDLWGNPKPVAGAMRTLTDVLPVGAQVVAAPDQAYEPVYAAAFKHEDDVILALANLTDTTASARVEIEKAADGLVVSSARLHRRVAAGDPSLGEPDVSTTEAISLAVETGADGERYTVSPELPPWATLTVILRKESDDRADTSPRIHR